jgi:hypothetical protein
METEVQNMAEFEQRMTDYASGKLMEGLDSDTVAAMKSYSEMWSTGRREILRIA